MIHCQVTKQGNEWIGLYIETILETIKNINTHTYKLGRKHTKILMTVTSRDWAGRVSFTFTLNTILIYFLSIAFKNKP